jgi:hypothetical protein
MTSKNAFGSIPWADVKSVPVFFSDFIAARIPCTAATQDTREKTASVGLAYSIFFAIKRWRLTDDFGSHLSCLLRSKGWGETTRNDIDEDLNGEFSISCLFFLSFGLRNLLASGQELAQSIREDP